MGRGSTCMRRNGLGQRGHLGSCSWLRPGRRRWPAYYHSGCHSQRRSYVNGNGDRDSAAVKDQAAFQPWNRDGQQLFLVLTQRAAWRTSCARGPSTSFACMLLVPCKTLNVTLGLRFARSWLQACTPAEGPKQKKALPKTASLAPLPHSCSVLKSEAMQLKHIHTHHKPTCTIPAPQTKKTRGCLLLQITPDRLAREATAYVLHDRTW